LDIPSCQKRHNLAGPKLIDRQSVFGDNCVTFRPASRGTWSAKGAEGRPRAPVQLAACAPLINASSRNGGPDSMTVSRDIGRKPDQSKEARKWE
jgi:hypothetical protein